MDFFSRVNDLMAKGIDHRDAILQAGEEMGLCVRGRR